MEVTLKKGVDRHSWGISKKNKVILGTFLAIILITIILKVVITILWDTGYYKGSFHLWYWQDPKVAEILNKANWNSGNLLNSSGTDIEIEMAHRALTHPYFFWSLTQFTWQTTLLITLIIIFRLFMYEERIPKWLRWTQSQKTLSLVTIYDVIVCIVFWSALAKDFSINESSTDRSLANLINLTTILVHAIIPVIMVIYSLTYLILSTEASRLNRKFLWIGIIYPFVYVLFYILMSVTWKDPYPVSNMSVTHNFTQIWLAFFALLGLFVGTWLMIFIHNYILFTFNKKYRYERDFEVIDNMEKKLIKQKRKLEKSKRRRDESNDSKNLEKEKILIAKLNVSIHKLELALGKRSERAKKSAKKYELTVNKEKNKKINNKSEQIMISSTTKNVVKKNPKNSKKNVSKSKTTKKNTSKKINNKKNTK